MINKLEKKLIDLGYEPLGYYYSKDIYYETYKFTLVIIIDADKQFIEKNYFYMCNKLWSISSKNDLELFENELQQAFNQLQSDLEELSK